MLTTTCKANLSQIFGLYPDPQNEAQNLLEITRHTKLMYAEDRSDARTHGRFEQGRVHVERLWLDIDEHGRCLAITDGVGRCDERVTDRNDVVTGAYADSQ